MALLARASDVSLDTSSGMFAPQIAGLLAGAAIAAGDALYIKSSDNRLYPSNGTAANEAAEFVGMAAAAASAGEPVTAFGIGARFHYGSGLTPGDKYFIAATAGRLDTAATTGGVNAIARAVDTTDIVIIRASE